MATKNQPESLLRVGSKGEDVAELQSGLSDLGFFHGNIDGIFGAETGFALAEFQEMAGLPNDGVAGPQTFAALKKTDSRKTPETGAAESSSEEANTAGPEPNTVSGSDLLSPDELERHVRDALQFARESSGEPITALDALHGIVNTSSTSRAFEALRQSLKKNDVTFASRASGKAKSNQNAAFELSRDFSDTLWSARRVTDDRNTIWGRTLVSAILYCPESLYEPFADGENQAVEPYVHYALQRDWTVFLSTNDKENIDNWEEQIREWENQQVNLRRAFWLTWTPADDAFPEWPDRLREFGETGSVEFDWPIDDRSQAREGDRVFLLRTGDNGGIVGVGQVSADRKDLADSRVPVTWQHVTDDSLISRDFWDNIATSFRLPDVKPWEQIPSGMEILPHTAETIERYCSAAIYVSQPGPLQPPIARVSSDRVSASDTDHIGVEQESMAFARLVASHETYPPLSIGVFGEWGSGKTFFMEKMRNHVAEIQRSVGRARDGGDEAAYFEDIVQIRFNAWHYMDTNLWASLVEHIFLELDKWLRQNKKTQTEIDNLYRKLSTSRLLKLEAAEELIEARRRREESKKNVAAARSALAAAKSRKETVTLGEFWRAVQAMLPGTIDKKSKEKLQQAAKSVGFVSVEGSARELTEALAQMNIQANRGQLLAKSVMSHLSSPLWLVPLLVLIVGLPVAIPFLVDSLQSDSGFWSHLSATSITLSSLLATIAGGLGTAVKAATGALDRLGKFQEELSKQLAEREEKEPDEILQAEQVVAQREKEVEIAENSLESATGALEEAQSDFADTAVIRLNRFIRDKIVNGEYAKHLGIISSVRKDFEQLADIMSSIDDEKSQIEEFDNERVAYENRVKSLNLDDLIKQGLLLEKEREELQIDDEIADHELRYFNRIVLYIDDLDRCPPDTVVEVLQACHLLLSFPLFVVVVAVDTRWVLRALVNQYKDLLRPDPTESEAIAGTDQALNAATARDYLEKIFQIPYWVRKMEQDASESYATALVGDVFEDDDNLWRLTSSKQRGGSEQAPEEPEDKPRQVADVAVTKEEPAEKPGSTTVDADEPKPDARDADEPDAQPAPEQPEPDKRRLTDENDRMWSTYVDPNPESLRLTTFERNFIGKLARQAGQSPRTIKRFVNVYRLLRTTLDRAQLAVLVGPNGSSETYRSIITQLAILTGAPNLADEFFRELDDTPLDVPLQTLLNVLQQKDHVTRSGEWPVLRDSILALDASGASPQMVKELRSHTNIVRRYSFKARPG
jgi:peptidoglycan hydrolase-like protein with peptidoglycan-binding domain